MSEFYDYVITKPELNDETLEHFGVKGMRWGVRRMEKKGFGTKASKRAKKFNAAADKYDAAKSKYKSSVDKASKKKYKSEMKSAKKEVKDQYKKTKQARLADQGAELYGNNTRITDNTAKIARTSSALAMGGQLLKMTTKSNILPVNVQLALSKPVNTPIGKLTMGDMISISALAAGGTALAVDKAYKENQNRKLRAYYSYRGKD